MINQKPQKIITFSQNKGAKRVKTLRFFQSRNRQINEKSGGRWFGLSKYNSLLEAGIKTFTISSALGVMITHSYLRDIGFGYLFPIALGSTGTVFAILFSMGLLGVGFLLMLYLGPALVYGVKNSSNTLMSSPLLGQKPVALSVVIFQFLIMGAYLFDSNNFNSPWPIPGIAIFCSAAATLYFYRNQRLKKTAISDVLVAIVALIFTLIISVLPLSIIGVFIESTTFVGDGEIAPIFGFDSQDANNYVQAFFMLCWCAVFSMMSYIIVGSNESVGSLAKMRANVLFSLLATSLTFLIFTILMGSTFFKNRAIQIAGLSDRPGEAISIKMNKAQYEEIYGSM